MQPETAPEDFPTRRSLLGKLTGLIASIIGLALAIPLAGYTILPAFKRREKDWIEAGRAARLLSAQPRRIEVAITLQDGWRRITAVKSVWIIQKTRDDIRAYSPLCTHLGCAYRWEADRGVFFCPCHASVFDIDGRVLSGPAPRPLDKLPVKVENGRLWVIYKEFKPGTARQIEI